MSKHQFARAVYLAACCLLLLRLGGAAEVPPLHLLCWSEYVPQSVVDGFTHKTGVPVVVESYSSNEQMLERLRARPGYYDLIQPSGFYVETLAKEGGLERLEPARIPNLPQIDPAYRHLAFDPQGEFSVPWLAGAVGIVVNTAQVTEPIKTWADVFNGRHLGKIVVVDDGREMVAWALASQGQPITDVRETTLREQVAPILQKWLPQVKVFDSDSPKSALLDGHAEVGILWSGEAALLWQADHKYQFTLPSEGAHMFVDSLAIPKGAPSKAAAEAFINYCLEPAVSVQISRAYPYTNPNLGAQGLLSPEERANPASYPPGGLMLPMLRNEGNTPQAVEAFVRDLRKGLR